MPATEQSRRNANRDTHYARPLVARSPRSFFSFVMRAFEYIDADMARLQSAPALLPENELIEKLRATAPLALQQCGLPPAKPDDPYARVAIDFLVARTFEVVHTPPRVWADRERAIRVVKASQFAFEVVQGSKVKDVLNRGDRGTSGLTRYSIQSIERSFKTMPKAERWGFDQILRDVVNVRILNFIWGQARTIPRFKGLEGVALADRIEEHPGIAMAVARVIKISDGRFGTEVAQNSPG